jgi:hypothetical protein
MRPDDATRENRERLTAEVTAGTKQPDAEVTAELAAALLEIAELAMPDGYFHTDTRCGLARAVLAATGDPRVREYP